MRSAILNISGDLNNSGTITVGGTLSVAGNYIQTSGGALDEQIGGTPSSQQFGHLGVTDAANLAGSFNLALTNGFIASPGQDYNVLSFASVSGDFTTFTGLGSDFTETLGATDLELSCVAVSQVDLVVSNVNGPLAVTEGQPLNVTWEVTNSGTVAAAGSWQDSVYLSPTPSITADSTYIGAVAYTDGLAVNAMYDGSFNGEVPALAPGKYYLLIQADSLYEIPGADRANSIAAASNQVAVSVPALILGVAANGSFSGGDQDQYYQVTVPAGGALQITLASSANSGAAALYVGQGELPTPYNAQYMAAVAGQPDQTAIVPQVAAPSTYYIVVHSISGAAASAGYTLTATQTAALTVLEPATPWTGGNGGNVTIEIDGANFTTQTTASLTLGTTTIPATSIDFVTPARFSPPLT